jgi:hypothetical protein
LILPKFAHLFPANSAVVVSVNANRFRPILNEYTVEFGDGSTAKVFEFQIIEDLLSYTTGIARLVFDSRHQQAKTQMRGLVPGFQIILQSSQFDLDMRIRTSKSLATIVGQVLERSTKTLLKNLDVRLMKDGMPLGNTTSDSHGVFNFTDVPRGALNILVIIPQYTSRILGALTV